MWLAKEARICVIFSKITVYLKYIIFSHAGLVTLFQSTFWTRRFFLLLQIVLPGWLEPLLDRIKSNYTNVVTPVIEIINTEDFSMGVTRSKDVQVGGFGWSLTFTWHVPPDRDRERPGAPYSPLRYVD